MWFTKRNKVNNYNLNNRRKKNITQKKNIILIKNYTNL